MKKLLAATMVFFLMLAPIYAVQTVTAITTSQTSFTTILSGIFSKCFQFPLIKGADGRYSWTYISIANTAEPLPVPVPVPVPASIPTPAPTSTPTPSASASPSPSLTPSPIPKPTPAPSSNGLQTEMLGYMNAERAKANLAPLILNSSLNNGATLKSKDMAVNKYFDHNSPTYGSPFEMMKGLGISYRAAGENIAKNVSVKGAHNAFMNSPGHKANILNSTFHKTGLGFYKSGSYLYVTQWFTN